MLRYGCVAAIGAYSPLVVRACRLLEQAAGPLFVLQLYYVLMCMSGDGRKNPASLDKHLPFVPLPLDQSLGTKMISQECRCDRVRHKVFAVSVVPTLLNCSAVVSPTSAEVARIPSFFFGSLRTLARKCPIGADLRPSGLRRQKLKLPQRLDMEVEKRRTFLHLGTAKLRFAPTHNGQTS